MLSIVAGALIETLTKHMFQKYLNEQDKIEIDGAPSWYMKSIDNKICIFSQTSGGMGNIEKAKKQARFKMVKKINGIVDIVVYDNYKDVKSAKEKSLVSQWKQDSNLPTFIKKTLNYSRLSYEEEVKSTFIRACIPTKIVFEYEKTRLKLIKSKLLKYKTNKAMDELDSSTKTKSLRDSKDPFAELDDEIN